ncbi:MAG: serine/threonine-protein kinase [Anaerolineae bacterium]|nr:serine/threonine-protein kinase [Anaerolineae bacterium]
MADLVAGRYRIIKLLGEGGMGEVYIAHDERLKRDVAIKRLHVYGANKTQLDTFHARFEREAISMAQFIHPYIVPVYDFGSDEEGVYLVMGLMTGGSLKDRMGKIMPVDEAAKLLIPIANALGYVHSHRIIHRDVKPHNILFNEHNVPMISDFGIVKLVESDGVNLTSTGTGVGTPAYMAPEQMTTRIDARADQYSLGIILYEMLTGRIPFEGETPVMTLFLHRTEPLPNPRLFAPTLSDKAVEVLNTALAKNPDDRYPDMNAFMEALQAAAQEPPLDLFVEAESDNAQDAASMEVLHQTMVGAPSLFTEDPREPVQQTSFTEKDPADIAAKQAEPLHQTRQSDPALPSAVSNRDELQPTTAHSSAMDGGIEQAFAVPSAETIDPEPGKPNGKNRKKKQEPKSPKGKPRFKRWLLIAAPLVVVFCLLMVLLQECTDLGKTLEQLSVRGTEQPIEEFIENLSGEIEAGLDAGLTGAEEQLAQAIGSQDILIVGDPAMQGVVEQVTAEFLVKYPAWKVNVAGGGSLTALTAIATDKADFGMSRRYLTEQDWERFPNINPIPVAINPMGILCNEATTVTDLMLDDLRRILSGEIKNWNEFGGPDAPIHIYVADFDDDATQAFTMIVMGEDLVTDQIEFFGTPEQVVQAVKDDPNGIGILNRIVETGKLQYISINGVEPNEQAIRNGRYKLAYELLLVTHGEPDEKEWVFLEFLFSPQGSRILLDHGLVPVKLADME